MAKKDIKSIIHITPNLKSEEISLLIHRDRSSKSSDSIFDNIIRLNLSMHDKVRIQLKNGKLERVDNHRID